MNSPGLITGAILGFLMVGDCNPTMSAGGNETALELGGHRRIIAISRFILTLPDRTARI
jgi:hypothetical protein